MLNFFQFISLVTTILLVLLIVVMGTHEKRKRISSRMLILFLLSNALLLIGFVFYNVILFKYFHFYFLLAPLLYLYTKYFCRPEIRFQKRDMLHAIPFMLDFFAKLSMDAFRTDDAIIKLLENPMLHVQIFVYVFISIRRVLECRTRLKNFYSSTETINLSWLLIVVLCFTTMWIMDLINWILYSVHVAAPGIHNLLLFLSLAINFGFAVLIVYQGLKHTDLFMFLSEKSKYEWSRLSHSEKEQYLGQLKGYMTSEKPYLTPSLTIKDLSNKISIPQRYLSQIINEFLKQNFYDFVNEYRIEAAKHYLTESASSKKTVLEILYEVGFNSKSAFNLAFKQHTGLTPKEFKRSIR